MTLNEHLLRAAGTLVMWAGYGTVSAKRALHAVCARIMPRRGWRTLDIGHLTLQVPSDWGDLEPSPGSGFVIHNRPRRFRVEGDAVWYSSAIELRIRRPDMEGLPHLAPMTETCRTIHTGEDPLVLALVVANGVGTAQRREAHRVLAGARAKRKGQAIRWPAREGDPHPGGGAR
jgi:hypothetical protein